MTKCNYRYLLVDDEAIARSELQSIINSIDLNSECHEAEDGHQALMKINAHNYDLVFLDIDMPRLDGLLTAELIVSQAAPPAIIFATAYNNHAIRGFELNAVDYILKPYDPKRIAQALSKAHEIIALSSLRKTQAEHMTSYLKQQRSEQNVQKLWAERENGERRLVDYSDIGWISALNKHVYVQLAKEQLRVKATMAELEAYLPATSFVRIHRSHIVNINLIRSVIPWDSHSMTLILGDSKSTELPVSRKYADQLRHFVGW